MIISLGFHSTDAAECRSVQKGSHYSSLIPFHGLKSDAVISTRVKFNNNTARYLFPQDEIKGHLCTTSWNKLWGACRCGYFVSNHKDSDRFVFRRAGSCLRHEMGRILGEIDQCPESDLIEIAAYAYDNEMKPFEHQGTLLKDFDTKLRVETWYKLTLTFTETMTIYELFDSNDQFLEKQQIVHRYCKDFKLGMMQDLYFGGQCPSPQEITVCYDKV